jgi:hypothetical protein
MGKKRNAGVLEEKIARHTGVDGGGGRNRKKKK